jgi:hypothetical protein
LNGRKVEMGSHLVDGEFQSDKYPTTPRGKVPLSVKDTAAQDLLWEYAQRRRAVDAEFSADMETALRDAGYEPKVSVCFDCKTTWVGKTGKEAFITPPPTCAKCKKVCTFGGWVMTEGEARSA